MKLDKQVYTVDDSVTGAGNIGGYPTICTLLLSSKCTELKALHVGIFCCELYKLNPSSPISSRESNQA